MLFQMLVNDTVLMNYNCTDDEWANFTLDGGMGGTYVGDNLTCLGHQNNGTDLDVYFYKVRTGANSSDTACTVVSF